MVPNRIAMSDCQQPPDWLEFTTPQGPCSYLPAETASLSYRICAGMDAARFHELLRRGWRRHGCHLFRPVCPACVKCRSVRVDAARFLPGKSHRRCLRRNEEIEVLIGRPTVTEDHVRLYNAWHADMAVRRGWRESAVDAEEYAQAFLIGEWDFAREMLYVCGGRLVGVGLVDILDEGVSSVYFYHDPQWRDAGPGTFSILQELEFCRRTARPHLYLGYWIAECPSMAYKGNYGPREVLERYVTDDEEPRWRPEGE
jgi:arginine-tRNA-protein transferase